MITGREIHEQWAMTHAAEAKHWDDVSEFAKKLYETLARTINRETRSIVAVRCLACNEMVDTYKYSEHSCKGD